MPRITIKLPPGVNSQLTQVQAAGGWWAGNLMRWRQGQLEKIAGWIRLVQGQFAGLIRRMHAWADLEDHKELLVGTDVGLELVVDHVQTTLNMPFPVALDNHATWFLDNLGTNGLALITRHQLLVYPPGQLDVNIIGPPTDVPQHSNGMFVAMPQAQVIVWGTERIMGSSLIDPLYIRFSQPGFYDIWTATATNMAGTYRLGRGSKIVGGLQAPQTSLIFTDTDVWSMSYIGPPLVYGFTIIGAGCGLVAPHAVVTLGRATFWQGPKGLWQYGDTGVQPLPCAVHDYIFEDLDGANIFKCHAGANSIGNEIMFYFPSRTDGTGECSRYIKYNIIEKAWDYGKLARTAWINNSVYGMPLGADANRRIQQHERGFNDDDQPMRGVFGETGYSSITDGTQVMMVDQCDPDFKWFGKNGGIRIQLKALGYANGKPVNYGPFSATPTTQYFTPRVRGRYVAVRFDWEPISGFSARVGGTAFRVKPAGRRP